MLNVKFCSQRHIQNQVKICNGAFFTSVKPYFKNVLNSIELPLSFVFYTTHPFVKNLAILKTSREKLFLLTMEHFLSKFEIMQWNGAINKQKQPPEVFYKKRCSQKFRKIDRKHLYQSLFLIKKEALAQVFSCEFCKSSQNTFFIEHLWATAFE